MTDKELEEMWINFRDIPIDEDENIDEDFDIWVKGTNKYEIWQWFDSEYSLGLDGLLDNIG